MPVPDWRRGQNVMPHGYANARRVITPLLQAAMMDRIASALNSTHVTCRQRKEFEILLA